MTEAREFSVNLYSQRPDWGESKDEPYVKQREPGL